MIGDIPVGRQVFNEVYGYGRLIKYNGMGLAVVEFIGGRTLDFEPDEIREVKDGKSRSHN